MIEDIQCEKFIAIGHIIENMFSLNVKKANTTMNLIIYLHDKNIIDAEDVKHG
jgi:hypothetical protein